MHNFTGRLVIRSTCNTPDVALAQGKAKAAKNRYPTELSATRENKENEDEETDEDEYEDEKASKATSNHAELETFQEEEEEEEQEEMEEEEEVEEESDNTPKSAGTWDEKEHVVLLQKGSDEKDSDPTVETLNATRAESAGTQEIIQQSTDKEEQEDGEHDLNNPDTISVESFQPSTASSIDQESRGRGRFIQRTKFEQKRSQMV